jgi:hypothetical protein
MAQDALRAARPAVYGWFTATQKPIARFNGLTPVDFSHALADGSSRGGKDAKAPSRVLIVMANQR